MCLVFVLDEFRAQEWRCKKWCIQLVRSQNADFDLTIVSESILVPGVNPYIEMFVFVLRLEWCIWFLFDGRDRGDIVVDVF